MKKLLTTLALSSALASGSLGLATLGATTAGAASKSHVMMAHTWQGKVGKVDAMMGTEESFTLIVDMKTYKVDYNAMTHFAMGTKMGIVKGAKVSVTGTLTMKTIKATKLSI
jgi:ABC-type taurine transport system substrate-binding protein